MSYFWLSEATQVALPVSLITFRAKPKNSQNLLTWATASETNNRGFEIERSADARQFEKIGFVDGNGDSQDENNYHFTDWNPFDITYYRLKQLDHDGKYAHSKIIMVRNTQEINVYPNPAREEIFVSGLKKMATLEIRDQSGRVVLTQSVNALEPINTSALRTGIYTIKINETLKRLAVSK